VANVPGVVATPVSYHQRKSHGDEKMHHVLDFRCCFPRLHLLTRLAGPLLRGGMQPISPGVHFIRHFGSCRVTIIQLLSLLKAECDTTLGQIELKDRLR
jgi:hypothetical protein